VSALLNFINPESLDPYAECGNSLSSNHLSAVNVYLGLAADEVV
jgi:hypothetical protein